ncbi:MAG: hypothetical protein V4805_07050 [Pseudomonadota bacterium]
MLPLPFPFLLDAHPFNVALCDMSSPTELYDEIAIEFPAMWPQRPEWVWVNVHDDSELSMNSISALIDRYISSPEVVVIVHSAPGIGARLSKEDAASFIGPYVLAHDIQVSDSLFTHFLSVSRHGVATGDA